MGIVCDKVAANKATQKCIKEDPNEQASSLLLEVHTHPIVTGQNNTQRQDERAHRQINAQSIRHSS